MSPPPLRRILMTADAVGGVWNYALELTRGLGRHGVEVVLATMGPRPTPRQRAEMRQVENAVVHESDFRLEWMSDPWADVDCAGEWLCGLAREFKPDVIHLNGYAHAALEWNAPTVVVGHSCVLSWWRAVRHERAPREWNEYAARVRAGLARADCVIAPTRAMLQALEFEYGPVAHGRVIHNGSDDRRFSAAPKEPFILSVGRLWDEAKNAQALVGVAPQLAWPVVLAGSSVSPDGKVEAIPGVTSLGVCAPELLAGFYARAAIYALPARYEPFGLSVLEAALSGCALVLGDIPSLREIWGDAARYVSSDDTAALRDTLTALIHDNGERAILGQRAEARARQFTGDRMFRNYLETYRALSNAAARARPETLMA